MVVKPPGFLYICPGITLLFIRHIWGQPALRNAVVLFKAISLRSDDLKFSDVQVTTTEKICDCGPNLPEITESLPDCYICTRVNKQNGGEFASGPVSLKECIFIITPQRYAKRRKTKKIAFFRKKISKTYCGIKNNAYLCIESNGDLTDAAGSANQNETEMETLTFTKREINRNFIIKVSGLYNNEKINKAVGVSGFLTLVDDIALANRLLERAFDCPNDKCVCKLRRGIKFTFYCH